MNLEQAAKAVAKKLKLQSAFDPSTIIALILEMIAQFDSPERRMSRVMRRCRPRTRGHIKRMAYRSDIVQASGLNPEDVDQAIVAACRAASSDDIQGVIADARNRG